MPLLISLVVIGLWIGSYARLKPYGKPAVDHFLKILAAVGGISLIAFIGVMIAAKTCSGLYCGLNIIIVFVFAELILWILLPLIMLTWSAWHFKQKHQSNQEDTN